MSLASAIEIAQQLTPRVLPLVPYFVRGAGKLKEKFLETLQANGGKDAFDIAEKIWKKLKPKLEDQPEVKETIKQIAEKPSSPENVDEMIKALSAILQDEKTRKAIADLMDKDAKKGTKISSYIKAGQVYGKVYGVRVISAKSLKAHTVISRIITGDVKKGGVVVGVQVGSDEDE